MEPEWSAPIEGDDRVPPQPWYSHWLTPWASLGAVVALVGLLWIGPTVLWLGYYFFGTVSQEIKIHYFDSGMALGKTATQLDLFFPRESYSPGGNEVHYDLGWVFLTHYYARVQFDPTTGKAIKAEAVYDDW